MTANNLEQQKVTSVTQVEPAALQYDLVVPPKPKPPSHEIKKLHARFYGGIARGFDEFNARSTRGLYFDAINTEIASHLAARGNIGRLLSVAAGTGFREESIRRLSGLDFDITCVDISPEMCEIAAGRGFTTICSGLSEANLAFDSFDACIFLNAFEVLCSSSERLEYFQKISSSLKNRGLFFVDAMDIDDRNDSWADLVKEQFKNENLQDFGYELGDCFCRRTDQESIVFAHYSNREEMQQLFANSKFEVSSLQYFSEETGMACGAYQGNMFFMAEKDESLSRPIVTGE
jgi:SAM-dependent methyltransferase